MPSTLVHVAIGALVGVALLADAFDARAAAVVVAAAALPDLDTFAGLYLIGAHRALLHTLLLPLAAGVAVAVDARRDRSALRERYGPRGVRVAAVAVVALAVGGVLPDLVTNGVNALYPLHDQFYTVDGKLVVSNRRGLVQTFVDLTPTEPARTTSDTQFYTGVDPKPAEPGAERDVERVFPIVRSGTQLLLVVAGLGTLAVRLWEERR